jgi:KaiC/GvpD/RAD55 family RecA-like ATPase
LATDFSKPIAKGNFVLIKGETNTGKSFFCAKTAALFADQNGNKSVLSKNLKRTKTIYITTNFKNAEKIKGIINQSSIN